jgi:hypothetical protein
VIAIMTNSEKPAGLEKDYEASNFYPTIAKSGLGIFIFEAK